jgi:hypothetical protein
VIGNLEGRGFISCPILDINGVKAMPGLFPAPNPGSFNNQKKENIGSQMGHTKKFF